MAPKLSEQWKQNWTSKILQHGGDSQPLELVTAVPMAKTWFVMQLTNYGIPFAVHQLGAGVTKITTDTQICSKCHGSGRVKT